jgi:dTDP-4-dehydrorhamnose 3,5-epimerase
LSLIVPEGFGHAILALEDNSVAVYANSAAYNPGVESGIRFDDPALNVSWPLNRPGFYGDPRVVFSANAFA